MFPPRYDRYQHVVFIDGALGVRAQNLAPGPDCTAILPRCRETHDPADAADPLDAHDPRASQLSDDEARFIRWLFRQAGLDVRHYRQETLRRRLHACLRVIRAGSVVEARIALARHSELLPLTIGSLLIGVSSFFRDPQVFHTLAEVVLPRLGLPRDRRPVNVWSIGCSEGQELYSIAMLLSEQRRLPGSYLLGTDCREDAVRHAIAGVYADDMMRSVPPAKLLTHFRPLPAVGWQVSECLRRACRWRRGDILRNIEPGRWDMILCRNVAMYFKPIAADALWAALETALAPGGVLVLGRAERPSNTRRLTVVAPCIYRKLGS